jgi:hypothetical protein
VIAESRDALPAGRWEIVDVVDGFEGRWVRRVEGASRYTKSREGKRFARALGGIGDEEGGKTVDF